MLTWLLGWVVGCSVGWLVAVSVDCLVGCVLPCLIVCLLASQDLGRSKTVSVATEVANKKWRPRIATLYGAPQAIPPSHPIWYFRRRVLLSSAGRMTDPRICVLHPRMQHRLGHLQIHVLHLPALLCMTHDWHATDHFVATLPRTQRIIQFGTFAVVSSAGRPAVSLARLRTLMKAGFCPRKLGSHVRARWMDAASARGDG